MVDGSRLSDRIDSYSRTSRRTQRIYIPIIIAREGALISSIVLERRRVLHHFLNGMPKPTNRRTLRPICCLLLILLDECRMQNAEWRMQNVSVWVCVPACILIAVPLAWPSVPAGVLEGSRVCRRWVMPWMLVGYDSQIWRVVAKTSAIHTQTQTHTHTQTHVQRLTNKLERRGINFCTDCLHCCTEWTLGETSAHMWQP